MEEQNKFNEERDQQAEQTVHGGHQPAHDIQFSAEELESRLTDDPKSIGLDLDGTNPGSRSHPVDFDSVDEN